MSFYFALDPQPVSNREFPPDIQEIVIHPAGQERVVHTARTLSVEQHAIPHSDSDLLLSEVQWSLHRVRDRITEALIQTGCVADPKDYWLDIVVRARVKTWPAVPGLTIPLDDDDENPMLIGAS